MECPECRSLSVYVAGETADRTRYPADGKRKGVVIVDRGAIMACEDCGHQWHTQTTRESWTDGAIDEFYGKKRKRG